MRVERNRNWGYPEFIHFLKTFAPLAAKATGWHGIRIGDMAQPRAPRPGLQPHPRNEHPGHPAAHGGDPGVVRSKKCRFTQGTTLSNYTDRFDTTKTQKRRSALHGIC
jgi:Penicillin-insensitive murein endopeptidase